MTNIQICFVFVRYFNTLLVIFFFTNESSSSYIKNVKIDDGRSNTIILHLLILNLLAQHSHISIRSCKFSGFSAIRTTSSANPSQEIGKLPILAPRPEFCKSTSKSLIKLKINEFQFCGLVIPPNVFLILESGNCQPAQ